MTWVSDRLAVSGVPNFQLGSILWTALCLAVCLGVFGWIGNRRTKNNGLARADIRSHVALSKGKAPAFVLVNWRVSSETNAWFSAGMFSIIPVKRT